LFHLFLWRPLTVLLLLCGALWPAANLLAAAPPAPASAPPAAAVNEAALKQAQARFEILLAAGLYTRWPAGAFERPKEGPSIVRIGIVGNDPQASELESLACGRQIAGRQVVVRNYHSRSEIEPCQILFLADSLPASDRLALIEKYKSSPVLLAGETPGFCLEGGGLNFQMENGSVKFALNPEALARQKLTVDPRFSRLARPASPSAPKYGRPAAAQIHQVRKPGKVHPVPGHQPQAGPQGERPHPGNVSSRQPELRASTPPPSGGKRP